MSLPALDSFDRANSSSTLGGNWTVASGGPYGVFSNEVYCPGGSGAVRWSADSFAADQYAQAICGAFYADSVICPAVRVTSGGDCYTLISSNLYKVISGSLTMIASGAVVGSGDTVKITAVGTTISLYKNGVLAATVTDASIASGSAGIYATSSSVTLNDWEGGNVGGGAAFMPRPNLPITQAVRRASYF